MDIEDVKYGMIEEQQWIQLKGLNYRQEQSKEGIWMVQEARISRYQWRWMMGTNTIRWTARITGTNNIAICKYDRILEQLRN